MVTRTKNFLGVLPPPPPPPPGSAPPPGAHLRLGTTSSFRPCLTSVCRSLATPSTPPSSLSPAPSLACACGVPKRGAKAGAGVLSAPPRTPTGPHTLRVTRSGSCPNHGVTSALAALAHRVDFDEPGRLHSEVVRDEGRGLRVGRRHSSAAAAWRAVPLAGFPGPRCGRSRAGAHLRYICACCRRRCQWTRTSEQLRGAAAKPGGIIPPRMPRSPKKPFRSPWLWPWSWRWCLWGRPPHAGHEVI